MVRAEAGRGRDLTQLADGHGARRARDREGRSLSFPGDLSGVGLIELVGLLAADEASMPVAGAKLVAVGWATVDLERTAADLPGLAFGDPAEVPALGARALRSRVGSIDLLLLEPSTEGRLAGWLARNGEGVAVFYVTRPKTASDRPGRPTALGRTGVLEVSEDRTKPFLFVLDPS